MPRSPSSVVAPRQHSPSSVPSCARWLLALALSIAVSPPVAAQTPLVVSGWVETLDGQKVKSVNVRVRTVGGAVTTTTGEFRIPLSKEHGPGDEIALDVEGWVIVSPYDGRTFVPRQRGVAGVVVVVAKKGDAAFLRNKEFLTRLVQDVTTRPGPSSPGIRPRPMRFWRSERPSWA